VLVSLDEIQSRTTVASLRTTLTQPTRLVMKYYHWVEVDATYPEHLLRNLDRFAHLTHQPA
jgi:hypothetical protein